jgi:hypothetical protein
MMAAVLESAIFLVVESSQLEYETYLQPRIRSLGLYGLGLWVEHIRPQ